MLCYNNIGDKMKRQKVLHPFEAVYNEHSKILILGTIASEKSREFGYPYAHPQNRFWRVLSTIFEEEITDYKEFLLKYHIALWDVIKSCEISKSSDSSIANIKVNEIERLLRNSNITTVFTNGRKATELYKKYVFPKTKIESIYLPSTSPANATNSLDKLITQYSIILKYLNHSKNK